MRQTAGARLPAHNVFNFVEATNHTGTPSGLAEAMQAPQALDVMLEAADKRAER